MEGKWPEAEIWIELSFVGVWVSVSRQGEACPPPVTTMEEKKYWILIMYWNARLYFQQWGYNRLAWDSY